MVNLGTVSFLSGQSVCNFLKGYQQVVLCMDRVLFPFPFFFVTSQSNSYSLFSCYHYFQIFLFLFVVQITKISRM